jgi:hypothetical protein
VKRHLARINMKRVFTPTSVGKSSPPCPLPCQGCRLAVKAAVQDYVPKHCYGIANRQRLSSAAMPHLAAMRFNVPNDQKRSSGKASTVAAAALHQTRRPQGRWKGKQPASNLSAEKDDDETMSGGDVTSCISTANIVSKCGSAPVVILRRAGLATLQSRRVTVAAMGSVETG